MVKFKDMTDENLRYWIEMYRLCPSTQIINNKEKYMEALEEVFSRWKNMETVIHCESRDDNS